MLLVYAIFWFNFASWFNTGKVEKFTDFVLTERKISDFKNIEDAIKAEEKVVEYFNTFSLEEKNSILTSIRENNSKDDYNNSIFSDIQEDLEKEWKFILDLSDKELKEIYLKKIGVNKYSRNVFDSCSAPLVSFPTPLNYKEKTSAYNSFSAYDYRAVKTEPDEYFCDTELFYYVKWDYVWADTWLASQMINSWYGWMLSSRNAKYWTSLVVWIKAKAFWLLDIWLKNRIKLLKSK